MIIIKIMGGLASQLHKYSLGRALALKHGVELKLDITWFENIPAGDTKREYFLEYYNINASIASEEEIASLLPGLLIRRISNAINRYFSVSLPLNGYISESFISKEMFDNIKSPAYLAGEWNGDEYFLGIREKIVSELTLKNNIDNRVASHLSYINKGTTASVHIRRGDYFSNLHANKLHGVVPDSYYKQAMHLSSKEGVERFVIFSDDTSWVKENLSLHSDYDVLYVENTTPLEDFYLMTQVDLNIISNSGFSWFSAWLGSGDIIYSPKCWVSDVNMNKRILSGFTDKRMVYVL